jgi:hypothetical protein
MCQQKGTAGTGYEQPGGAGSGAAAGEQLADRQLEVLGQAGLGQERIGAGLERAQPDRAERVSTMMGIRRVPGLCRSR